MLESQRQQFAALDTAQHRTYSLFFGTFDAVVMVASIYILFPKEHPELLDQARQHFQWAVDRFEKMAERNHLARSALGVLQAIWIRFKKAVGHGFLACHCVETARAETEAATRWLDYASQSETHASQRTSHDVSATSVPSSSTQPTPTTELTGPTPSDSALNIGQEWSLPTDFDFGAIMPMYPMGDIAYNDLTGVLGTAPGGPWTGAEASPVNVAAAGGFGMPGLHTMPITQEFPWQFGGEFGTDTIWNVLNQFPSS
jgi:hypothetical protein